MNSMNGAPIWCRPAPRRSRAISDSLDYEDFRATMIAAKKAGLIVDGPESRLSNYRKRTPSKETTNEVCLICEKSFVRKKGSTARACSPECCRRLQVVSAKSRIPARMCPVCNANKLQKATQKACSKECFYKLKPPKMGLCCVCNVSRVKSRNRKTCSKECSIVYRNEKREAQEKT